ncbi:S41 family peptidase [Streptomyces orinoci]|uniref:S41 family peptidase n=1 Tax=Streptomyces orinoci TaxID=67339 RepID=A0ABV3K5W8_STRON|nr:S41 family peptidase [Streptomyces orinoci]
MSGPARYVPRRRARCGAALTLVFAGVLVTGAAAGSWSAAGRHGVPPVPAAGEVLGAGTDDAGRHGGDRWGAVYSAEEYQGFQRALDGAYVGVGLSLRSRGDGRIEVADVQRGSPAGRSEIAAGDELLSVDGAGAAGRPVTEVVSRLRGDYAGTARAGTPVRLALRHGGRTLRLTLRRERLSAQSVVADRFRAGRTAGTKIKVGAFTRGTGVRVRQAVRETAPGEGVLLDLRGNSGGLVTEAVGTASAFLDGGLVATYDVHGRERVLRAAPGGDTGRPLVVLVDGGTMSAGELLAGALQDRGRAVLVGSRTFGKGSVQMPRDLPGGAVAEQTVGRYRTPSGRPVDGRGITPDLEVEGDAEPRARAVLGGLGGGS